MAASGKYYVDTFLGNVFVGSTAAAGVVLPIYTNTAQTFCVWNPLGSGKNIIPMKLRLGYVSTTAAAANIVIGYQTGVGSQVATGAAITAATLVAPVNMLLGAGGGSIAKFAPATITFAAAPSLLMTTGVSQLVTTAATTGIATFYNELLFEGELIVPPGTAIVVAGNIAQLQTWDVSMIWEEIQTSG